MLPETRVAKIIGVEEPVGLRNRAWVLTLDFGALGVKKSVGQFKNLSTDELMGRNVVAVVGLGSKKVGNYISECLVLGTRVGVDPNEGHYPLQPNANAKLGDEVL
jgi:tRNA-binding protein